MLERYGNRWAARRGFSLVELLVVCVLLVALGGGLAYFYLGQSRGEKPRDIVHTPISKANDVVCQSNIGQVRQALSMAQMSDSDGKFPQALTELKGLPQELLSCPTGHEPYVYDPTTGQVHCVHPGHENY
jgi:prepilin-type N-terminal cleavage/methylation domain-containing protein